MRAAIIERLGEPPVVAEAPDPAPEEGDVVVEVLAASLNPVDLTVAAGRFYAGPPRVPYVPGREGVGRVVSGTAVEPGTLVRFEVDAGFGRGGSLAERAAAPDENVVELPPETDPALAAALGIAGLAGWLPLSDRARLREGERVLVLGASGAVGQVAVQAARILGAATVVAAARSADGLRRAQELGADATVQLSEEGSLSELAERFRDAAGGELDVVVDPLWGMPARSAMDALARGSGRHVNVGQSAAPALELPSAVVRGRAIAVIGYSGFVTPEERKAQAYLELLEHALHGRLVIDHDVLALSDAGEAWRRQAQSPHRKLVLRP
jgi:NADPH2:quinone reductase